MHVESIDVEEKNVWRAEEAQNTTQIGPRE